jgi:hypothetical protein
MNMANEAGSGTAVRITKPLPEFSPATKINGLVLLIPS